MPSPNRLKYYLIGCYYHIYNRGVEKRITFQSHNDYRRFIDKMNQYKESNISIIAYCLMPNHFHLLVRNDISRGIEKFMRSLGTSYVMYFNKKYSRIGHLFQGPYKARLIENEQDLLTTTEYIHNNPIELEDCPYTKSTYPYSSYKNYEKEKDCP